MNIKIGNELMIKAFGQMLISYPDKWPAVPKSSKWFADYVRREFKQTKEPVTMEIHKHELKAVSDALNILNRRCPAAEKSLSAMTMNDIQNIIFRSWSVTQEECPYKEVDSTGWMRCRFEPPGKKPASGLYTEDEKLVAQHYNKFEPHSRAVLHGKKYYCPGKKWNGKTLINLQSKFTKLLRLHGSERKAAIALELETDHTWKQRQILNVLGRKKKIKYAVGSSDSKASSFTVQCTLPASGVEWKPLPPPTEPKGRTVSGEIAKSVG